MEDTLLGHTTHIPTGGSLWTKPTWGPLRWLYHDTSSAGTEVDDTAKTHRFDSKFLRELRLLNRITFDASWLSRESCLLYLLLALAILKEVSIYFLGLVPSMFYVALGSQSEGAFVAVLPWAASATLLVTLFTSLVKSTSDLLAVWSRARLTQHVSLVYVKAPALYALCRQGSRVDNPDHRIAQDTKELTAALGLVYARVIITPLVVVFYTIKTWVTMGWIGPLAIYAYFFIGSFATQAILSPIIPYVFYQERLEGDFRSSHARLKQSAEAVAFTKGEAKEASLLSVIFNRLVFNQVRVTLKEFPLNFSTVFWATSGAILSYFIIAIPVFSGAYAHVAPSDMAALISSTSFFAMYLINAFSNFLELSKDFASIAGYTGRLGHMLEEIAGSEGRPTAAPHLVVVEDEGNESPSIKLTNVSLQLPSRVSLVEGLSFEVRQGEGLLITGPNGSGKTTIVRALAGLWPQASGVVHVPRQRATSGRPSLLFMSQGAYVPNSTLRDVLVYPSEVGDGSVDHEALDVRLTRLLETVGMGTLLHRLGQSGLDAVLPWETTLSPGEIQRLCFARLFYHHPVFAVMDESTAALDIDTEARLYQHMLDLDITPVSVGHRPSLRGFHRQFLTLGAEPRGWTLT